jgi:stalled ribosome rescue protein Dom34
MQALCMSTDESSKSPAAREDRPLPGARHAVVWLDHAEATIISYTQGKSREQVVRSQHPTRWAHSDRGQSGSGHVRDDVEFFDEIARRIGDVPEVLIVGPGLAKTAFDRYVRKHHQSLAIHILGVKTVDHPTSGQILKYGKHFFQGVDQLLGDRPS